MYQFERDEMKARIHKLHELLIQLQQSYEEQEHIIANDETLSPIGKQKALGKMQEDRQAKIVGLVQVLRREAVNAAIAHNNVQTSLQTRNKDATGTWDYARLEYERKSVESHLALAGPDYDRINELWQSTKASHDSHKIRAMYDTLPALLPMAGSSGAYGTATRDSILEDMRQSQLLAESPEVRRLAEEQAEYLQALQNIGALARQVDSIMSDNSGVGTSPVRMDSFVLSRVFAGIHYDSDAGELHVDRQPNERADDYYKRTEQEYAERLKLMQQQAKRWETGGQFSEYQALLYGLEEV